MAEREKRAFKLNIVDVFITLIIACVVAVGAMMLVSAFGVNTSNDKKDVKVEYTIQFKGILDDFKNNVKVGDVIVDGQKRYNIGTVKRVWYGPYTMDVFNKETGKMQKAVYPDHVELNVVVEADGYMLDDRCYLTEGEMLMVIGTGISMHAPDLSSYGYVSDIQIYD